MCKNTNIMNLIDNVLLEDFNIIKCKKLVKDIRKHLKNEMESICDNVNKICSTPKTTVIENQRLYNYLLERLSNLWVTLLVYQELLEKSPEKYTDKTWQKLLDSILKIYNNSIIDIGSGEIVQLPQNLAVIFKKSHSDEDSKYYDMLVSNKNVFTIIY